MQNYFTKWKKFKWICR